MQGAGAGGRRGLLREEPGEGDGAELLQDSWEERRGPGVAELLHSEAFCDLWLLAGDPPERVPAARLLLAAASRPLARRLQLKELRPGAELRLPKVSAAVARAIVAYSCGTAEPFDGCSLEEARAAATAIREGDFREHLAAEGGVAAPPLTTPPQSLLRSCLSLIFQLCLLLGSLAAYYPTLSFNMEEGGAFMDDAMIRKNPVVVDENLDLQRLLRTDYWGLEMFDPQTWTHKSFRPLTVLTFRWGFRLHGLASHGFYTTNAALHGLATLQVAHFARRTCGMPPTWATLLAALFAAHPVHSESVCYVVGRADLLCLQALLLALAAYAPCCAEGVVMGPLEASVRLLAASGLLLVAGLCKETGFTFFGFLVGWEVLQLTRRGRARAGGRRRGPLLRIAALLALGASACYARVWYTSGTRIAQMDPYSNPVAAEPDPWVCLLSYLLVHGMYFRLLAWPTFLCYDYSMDAVPLVRSAEDLRLLLPCAGYLGLALALTVALRHLRSGSRCPGGGGASARGKQQEGPILGVAIFALSFLPMMNLLFPIGTLVAERLLYIPSAGFLCAVVAPVALLDVREEQFGRVIASQRWRTFMSLARKVPALATLVFWWVLCYRRVLEWQSVEQITMADGLKQLTSSRTQFNLGNLYLQHRAYDEALAAYRRAIAADPLERDSQPLYHAGQILLYHGQYGEAERYLQKAVGGYFSPLTMHEEEVWHDYGLALWHMGRGVEAIQNFHNSVVTNQTFSKGYNNLACACVLVGLQSQPPAIEMVQHGMQAMEHALALVPGMALYWRNAAVLLGMVGEAEDARRAWRRYRELEPRDSDAAAAAAPAAAAAEGLPRDCVWEFYFR